eukprot:m.826058 g.826058  ORF g.826058 m.826058 type:complete len:300 (-) comp23410_c0_seq7:1411-2310(-)
MQLPCAVRIVVHTLRRHTPHNVAVHHVRIQRRRCQVADIKRVLQRRCCQRRYGVRKGCPREPCVCTAQRAVSGAGAVDASVAPESVDMRHLTHVAPAAGARRARGKAPVRGAHEHTVLHHQELTEARAVLRFAGGRGGGGTRVSDGAVSRGHAILVSGVGRLARQGHGAAAERLRRLGVGVGLADLHVRGTAPRARGVALQAHGNYRADVECKHLKEVARGRDSHRLKRRVVVDGGTLIDLPRRARPYTPQVVHARIRSGHDLASHGVCVAPHLHVQSDAPRKYVDSHSHSQRAVAWKR